uniref:U50-Deinotoxin-Dsu1b_1 n=1 Tax=Deinopis subrufa TaxID=1905329 RepID=A0A4Q8KCC2_DEISU
MKLLFLATALISVSLIVAEICPNGGYCDGACCKSWFHYRCCPHVNGVCCAGGFQCCPAGKSCVGWAFSTSVLASVPGPSGGWPRISSLKSPRIPKTNCPIPSFECSCLGVSRTNVMEDYYVFPLLEAV